MDVRLDGRDFARVTASSRANLSGAAFLLKDSVAAAAAEHAAGVARAMRPVGLKGTYKTSHMLSNTHYATADRFQQRVRLAHRRQDALHTQQPQIRGYRGGRQQVAVPAR